MTIFEIVKNRTILDNKTDTNGVEHGSNGQFVSKGGNREEKKDSGEKKDQRGAKIEQVSGIMNINDCEFEKPTRSYLLPQIDEKFAKAIKKENKKNIAFKSHH